MFVGIHRHERGQATVELALCLPLVALILGAVVEIGMLVGDRARLEHAAREAARAATVDPDAAAVRAAAERGGLEPLDVTIAPEPLGRRAGEPVTVELGFSPEGGVPLVGELFERIRLHATATMRIEQP